MKQITTSREQGAVSLLTVMFFMIFISLIVVGFISQVVNDQRQTIDNDLSASALAAARSGVEDGKRILLYCRSNPAAAGCVDAVLNSADNCDVFKGVGPGPTLAAQLGIPVDAATGQGATANASNYKQYFSCLTIQQDTSAISADLSIGTGYIQQLRSTGNYNSIRLTWSGSGTYANRGAVGTSWPRLGDWKAGAVDYPPALQLQIIPYTSASFTTGPNPLDVIENGSKMIYIAPCGLVAACNTPSKDINTLDQRSAAGLTRMGSAPLTYATCSVVGAAYNCSVQLTGLNGGPALTQYYIRASVLYATSTSLEVSLFNGANRVNFDNVQPWIDVTGRTNDVFRRVRTEVNYQTNTIPTPQNAIDSAAPICKDMTVTAIAASSTYNCN